MHRQTKTNKQKQKETQKKVCYTEPVSDEDSPFPPHYSTLRMIRRGTPPQESKNIPNTKFSCRNGTADRTWALRERDGKPGGRVKGARVGDSSNTGMLRLPKRRAPTRKVGKGSMEGGAGGQGWEGGGHGGGAGEKHKGFHVAIGWGTTPFQTFQKKNIKNKKPQTPCQTKRAMI